MADAVVPAEPTEPAAVPTVANVRSQLAATDAHADELQQLLDDEDADWRPAARALSAGIGQLHDVLLEFALGLAVDPEPPRRRRWWSWRR